MTVSGGPGRFREKSAHAVRALGDGFRDRLWRRA
jgi:hypothetical protein